MSPPPPPPVRPPPPPAPPPVRPPPPPPPPAAIAGFAAAVFSASRVHLPAKFGDCANTVVAMSRTAIVPIVAVTRRIRTTPSNRGGHLPPPYVNKPYSNRKASIGSRPAAFRAG